MSDYFKPESLTIEAIFSNADSFYQMPIYQRPYSWDKDRVEQLWADIFEAYENHKENPSQDNNYFLGSLVVVKNKNGAYDVVDGQQRITTLTILFCVLRDLSLPAIKEHSKKIQNSIANLVNDKVRLKLTTQLNNQAIFEETVLNGIKFNELNKNKKDNRFLRTASYFKDLIEKVEANTLNEFVKYLFENTVLIRIACTDESFAIKLFSVLNDRGLDLTSADIIKAHLMQQLDDEKRPQFNEEWKKLETICQQMDESLTNVFNLYLYYQTGKNPKSSLQDELKKEFKDKNANSIILDLKKFANFLFEINESYNDKDISRLWYLPHSVYWKSILLTAKMVDYEQYGTLKSLLVKYYYQSWIADGTANRIKQTSFNIIKMVKENKSIDEIKSIIVKNLSEYSNYLDYLDRTNIYSSKWHKPLLLAVEYNQQDNYPYIEINKSLHTEHILPQEWNDKNLNWSDNFDDNTAKLLLNSLGNLTLLSGNKNIRASNRNYADKKEIYIGKGLDGKTSFEITKWVFENYPDGWNADTIKERKEWLIDEIKKIFEIE
ncbi:DUF262 domain-containing protein [Moraxella equi]|uniref:Uncharacterized conserved protein n=1 Tax=Moraxella equi TaxID=60442 RepID=A0A378QU06_9GAMM|nr:DUF262 domain-containing protein [Moraxella equi]OPH40002.1 hypothetical protein B5J93_01290 [Moraxella equi]STZ03870.1 Uncharacterized conserved protein [Moraxella equi]